MVPLSRILRFAGVFALVYGVLIVPWPGWNGAYGSGLRFLCRATFGVNTADSIVTFRAAPKGSPLDTEIVIADPHKLDARGGGPALVLGLDTRGVGWVPTALLAALVLSTPISWRRRVAALLAGEMAVNIYILLTVRIYIWSEVLHRTDNAGSLVGRFAGGLEETLATQLGASIVIPVIIWFAATFRAPDFAALPKLLRSTGAGDAGRRA
jgi:hypothetical protein